MKRIVVPHAAYATDEQVAAVIRDSFAVLKQFNAIYKYLSGAPTQGYNEDLAQIGFMPEDYVLENLQDKVASMNFELIETARTSAWFDTGVRKADEESNGANISRAVMKFYKGSILLQHFYQKVLMSTSVDVPTVETWKQDIYMIRYGMGDMTLSLTELLGIKAVLEAMAAQDTLSFDGVYQTLSAKYNLRVDAIAKFLVTLRGMYYSVIPVFEERPEEWYAMCDRMDPAMVDSLIDLGQYVWLLDIKAAEHGDLQIDEMYLNTLEERADRIETDSSIAAIYPDQWAAFQHAVPPEYAAWVISLEPILTIGIINPIVHDKPFDEKYVAVLKEFEQQQRASMSERTSNERTEKFATQ